MARLYRTQSARLAALRNAAAVVTLSQHMADEMTRNGVRKERVHVVPPFVSAAAALKGCATNETLPATGADSTCRLLYLGRLERLKGVEGLLRATGLVAAQLKRPVQLTVAGDGGERESLQALAAQLSGRDSGIGIEFAGWQSETGRTRLLAAAHALVVPSVWPEPFGLVGLEAAAAGVPAVAFPVGGIPEWLRDGENGCLGSMTGDRASALATAIVRCVESPERLERLRDGARRSASRWRLDRHVEKLEQVFETVVPAVRARQAV